MKRTHCLLAVLLLTVIVFSQVSCGSGGLFGGGGGAGIQIGAASPGTKVYLDGSYIGTVIGGKAGPTAYVAPGAHKLTAQAPGYEAFRMTVYAYSGQVSTYDLPLKDEMVPAKSETKNEKK